MTSTPQNPHQNANRRVVMVTTLVACAMLALGLSAKPLYNTFCKVTGYGGTTRIAESSSTQTLNRDITVRFDSNIAPNLPWTFKPEQKQVTTKLGENTLIFYRAKNNSSKPVVGTASYNVTPIKAAPYFSKIQCFCFTEQKLEPGEEVRMPVLFYVDPQLDEDERNNEIKTIILSYTFYPVEHPDKDVLTTEDRKKILSDIKDAGLSQ